jgi:hypothetical protein
MSARRIWLKVVLAIVGVTLAGGASVALAQGKLKVAAVYTVRSSSSGYLGIHKALNAAKDRGRNRVRVLGKRSPTPTTSA